MLTTRSFAELYDVNNTTGRTRINAAGLIVGVDFSMTSNTIGTGSRTFVLTADMGVNRDWPMGDRVIAVDQVGGGTMRGTVTSYTPSTQTLVINVVTITGSGTSTNWRIGNLEARRNFDPVTLQPTGLVLEGQATNLLTRSQGFNDAAWSKTGLSVISGQGISPDGSNNLFKLVEAANGGVKVVVQPVSYAAGTYTFKLVASPAGRSWIALQAAEKSRFFNLSGAGSLGVNNGTDSASIKLIGPGLYELSITISTAAINNNVTVFIAQDDGVVGYTGDGTSGVIIWGAQLEIGSTATSYNPTTTAQVTRTAEIIDVNPTRLAELFRQGEGTIYFDANLSGNISGNTLLDIFMGGNGENRIGLFFPVTGALDAFIVTQSGIAQIRAGVIAEPGFARIALAFGNGILSVSLNGADAVQATYSGSPTIQKAYIGRRFSDGNNTNANLRKFGIRPNRISNSNLKLISAGTLDFFQAGEIV